MKTSIALATFNGSAFLAAQLQSFVRQTRPPDEVVVVDDASTDQTPAVVERFAETAPFPVRLTVNDANLGYAQNFSKALSLCTGDLVFLSDQDDVWLDGKIERIAALASEVAECGCIMNDAMLTNASLVPSGVTKRQNIKSAGLPDSNFVMGCCVAVKRRMLDIALPIPTEERGHDSWLVGLSDALNLTVRLPEVLQYYRIHGRNASDFIVNRPRKVSGLSLLRSRVSRLGKSALSGASLEHEYRCCERITRRISLHRETCVDLAGTGQVAAAEAALAVKLDMLAARRDVRRTNRLTRFRRVASLWAEGGYRVSGGLPGAAKDLLVGSLTPDAFDSRGEHSAE